MKAKQLATLVILAVAVGTLAYVSRQQGQKRYQPSPLIGKTAFPDLPVNDVSRLEIVNAGSTSVVARAKDGRWGVPGRWNYPADFDKIADTLVMLSELKIKQVLQPAPGQLAAFKLQAPGAAAPAEETGVEVRLLGAGSETLASFVIGKERMRQPPAGGDPMMSFGAFPDGQYIRQGDGPILMVSGRLGDLADPDRRWLDEDFISVPASDIVEMTVAGPDRAEIKLERKAPGESLLVSGIATNQEADETKVNQMAGAFSYLGFDDVADPGSPAEKLGLAKPVRVTARTQANRTYVFDIGAPVSESNPDRYVKVWSSYAAVPLTNAPADEKSDEAARKAQEDRRKAHAEETAAMARETASFNERTTNWVFIVKSDRLAPLLVRRDEIVTIKPAETNAPSSNAVSAAKPVSAAKETSAAKAAPASASNASGAAKKPGVEEKK